MRDVNITRDVFTGSYLIASSVFYRRFVAANAYLYTSYVYTELWAIYNVLLNINNTIIIQLSMKYLIIISKQIII